MNWNPLPGVPLLESPFFEKFVGEFDPETARVARALHEKGYAIIEFPDPDFSDLAEGIKKDFQSLCRWDEWRDGRRPDLRIQDAWEFDSRVKSIAANEHVLTLLSRLYGRRAFPFQTLTFAVGTQQDAHSDHVHFNSVPDRFMCGVWVALEDVDEENGPLFYYPGSNKWPSVGNEHIGVNHTQLTRPYAEYQRFVDFWEALAELQNIKRENFLAKKGQALIWTSNLVHGGSALVDKSRTRWSQVTHYFFDDCGYTSPVENDVYAGQIYYRRIVDVSTGKLMNSRIGGLELTTAQIDALRPKHVKATSWEVNAKIPSLVRTSEFKSHPDIPNGFDANRYLVLNGDVKNAGVDPYEHFVLYGKGEGRVW